MSAPYDWSRFVVRININAPAQKLYKSKDGKLRTNEEEVSAGDTYKWLWHGWPDDTVEYGTIEEANGKDFFKFSFGKAGNCSVRIFKDNGENFVEITQEDIPDDDLGRSVWHVGCKTGWTFHLTNMKSIFEGGNDLRNKNEP